MRIQVLRDVELWSTSGERLCLRKGQSFDFSDRVALRLIERGKAVAVETHDPDLTVEGEQWRKGWNMVATLPQLPPNDPRTQERDSLIDTCERFFARGCLCLFEHTVSKLRALMRERW